MIKKTKKTQKRKVKDRMFNKSFFRSLKYEQKFTYTKNKKKIKKINFTLITTKYESTFIKYVNFGFATIKTNDKFKLHLLSDVYRNRPIITLK